LFVSCKNILRVLSDPSKLLSSFFYLKKPRDWPAPVNKVVGLWSESTGKCRWTNSLADSTLQSNPIKLFCRKLDQNWCKNLILTFLSVGIDFILWDWNFWNSKETKILLKKFKRIDGRKDYKIWLKLTKLFMFKHHLLLQNLIIFCEILFNFIQFCELLFNSVKA